MPLLYRVQAAYQAKLSLFLDRDREKDSKNQTAENAKHFDNELKTTDSLACWAVICFLIHLGDRHNTNIMADKEEPHCVHFIDFEAIFGYGLKLNVPELLSMRLTPYMMSLMRICTFETRFIDLCHKFLLLIQ